MILWILLGFVIIAGIQWALIKRLPYRIARVLIQVPLLTVTILGTMFLLAQEQARSEVFAQQAALDRIVERATISRGDIVLSVSATGSITPQQQAPLVFSVTNATVDAINVIQGARVSAGDVLATVVSTDFDQAVDEATVALTLQQISYDVLTQPASAEDIAVAQAQLEAADAQLLAAFSTGTTAQDTQIAFYNTELARNQLWQLQLQRDILADPTPIEIDTDPVPDQFQADVDAAIQELNRQIRAANAAQARQAENTVIAGEFGVEIADASYEGTLQRGADPGSVAVANAGVIQAEIAYDQLINGPSELQLAQAETQLSLATLSLELAEVNLAQTELVAPFDGVIAQSNLTLNELPPQGAAFILIDDSGYFVNLPIDETDITSVAIGQTVTFDVDALPDA
ncbi:MAG: HlyD family efflux transporter periplasmic adaptor subunit, partial [Chloroflexota bacterium]